MKMTFVVFLLICLAASTSILINPAKASGDSWTQKASMPSARLGFGLAVVGSKIYAVGGLNGSFHAQWLASNEEYDTTTDNWTEKAPMPTARAYFAMTSYQGKVYTIGGTSKDTLSSVNEVYDPSTNTWETKTPLPVPRQMITASAVNGKIYVFGGASGGTTDMYVYDIGTDVWSTKPSIYESKFFTSSVVLDNEIYVFTSGLDYLLIYDVAADNWKPSQSYSPRLSSSAIAATTGITAAKRIYVIGGEKTGALDLVSSNRIYNPGTDSWTLGSDLPAALSGAVAAAVNDSIYVMGGTQTSYPHEFYLAENLQYTPINEGTSNQTSPSPTPSPTPTPSSTSSSSPSPSPSQSPNSFPSPSQAPSPSIPEFPSWIILAGLIVVTALVVIVIKIKIGF